MLKAGETYRLADDITIVERQGEDLSSGHVIYREQGRGSPVFVPDDTLPFVEQFRNARTVAQAISAYASELGVDSTDILDDACIVADHLRRRGFLLAADTQAGLPSWIPQVGDVVEGWKLTLAIRAMDESAAFFCESEEDGRPAFMKLYNPASPYGMSLLENESRILAQLDTGATPPTIAQSADGGLPHLVLSRAAGRTLATCIQSSWSLDTRVAISASLIDAYIEVHDSGVLHADIHDGNVMVEGDTLTLVDFGASRSTAFDTGLPGRPIIPTGYEPEAAMRLLEGRPAPDPTFASEQFAIAALIFKTLTRHEHLEFSSDKLSIYTQIAHEPSRTLSEFGIQAPSLSSVLGKALSKAPGDRYADMREFRAAFRQAVDEGVELDVHRSIERMLWSRPNMLPVAPTASVNFGAAGTALACLCLSTLPGQHEFLPLAGHWSALAAAEVGRDKDAAFMDSGRELARADVSEHSVLHKEIGLHLVDALKHHMWGNETAARAIVDGLCLPRTEAVNPDLFIGDLSLPLCLMHLGVEEEERISWLRETVHAGMEAALERYSGDSTGDYGLAHGMGGALYLALTFSRLYGPVDSGAFTLLKSRYLEGATQDAFGPRWRWGRDSAGQDFFMPGLCSGDAGHALIALELFRDEDTPPHRAALKASLDRLSQPDIWGAGHICCGSAGGALALAMAGHILSDADRLAAARALGATSLTRGFRDAPYSLMKGRVGAYLVSACLDPDMRMGRRG